MVNFYLQNNGYYFELDISINQNNIFLNCKFNNNSYFANLSLQQCYYTNPLLRRFQSLNEITQFFFESCQRNCVFIKDFTSSQIVLGIPYENQWILLELNYNLCGGGYQDFFQNQLFNQVNENPMVYAMKKIQINGGGHYDNNQYKITPISDINNPNKSSNPYINNIISNENNTSLVKYNILKNGKNMLFHYKELKGLLNLCLLKHLTNKLQNNIEIILIEQLKEIYKKLKNKVHLTGEDNQDLLLNNNNLINILNASKYLESKSIGEKEILALIEIIGNMKEKDDMINYWKYLSGYESNFSFFENQFIRDLKKCQFDYSLISINVLECEYPEKYITKKNECENPRRKIVYCPTNINPIKNKNEDELNYFSENYYGKGFYFSDSIDFWAFSLKENINMKDSIFSIAAFEIFYDDKKRQLIDDNNQNIYQNKIVEPNGLHEEKISNDKLCNLFNISSSKCSQYKEKNKSLFNEYIITESYQIFPLYTLTLKRNEYFVLWRDPNFVGENDFLEYLKTLLLKIQENSLMNFYFETSTEDALKFLLRRENDKPIIITSIGRDLSGKRFVDIARKILGFDIIVLFFSINKDHLEWIQNYDNCLYTNDGNIVLDYINNYNESGLIKLKSIVEDKYKIKLKPFSFDFLLYNKSQEDFNLLNTNSPYIGHVKIKNGDKYLCMKFDGSVIMDNEGYPWDITLLGNEITLFSNEFYLDIEEDKDNLIGSKYMKTWIVQKNSKYYYFINKETNNIISVEGLEVKVKKAPADKDEMFEFVDVVEE